MLLSCNGRNFSSGHKKEPADEKNVHEIIPAKNNSNEVVNDSDKPKAQDSVRTKEGYHKDVPEKFEAPIHGVPDQQMMDSIKKSKSKDNL
jgi:hypothetical protein